MDRDTKAPKKPPVVDLDAGGSFGTQEITLVRPFKFKGAVYETVTIRVPTGADVAKHVHGRNGIAEADALMCDLTGLSAEVFGVMYAGDRNAIDAAVGEHMRGVPPTSTTSSPTSASATPSATPS